MTITLTSAGTVKREKIILKTRFHWATQLTQWEQQLTTTQQKLLMEYKGKLKGCELLHPCWAATIQRNLVVLFLTPKIFMDTATALVDRKELRWSTIGTYWGSVLAAKKYLELKSSPMDSMVTSKVDHAAEQESALTIRASLTVEQLTTLVANISRTAGMLAALTLSSGNVWATCANYTPTDSKLWTWKNRQWR